MASFKAKFPVLQELFGDGWVGDGEAMGGLRTGRS